MRLGQRDPFGFERLLYDTTTGHTATSVAGLLAGATPATGDGPGGSHGPTRPRADRGAIAAHLNGAPLPDRTLLQYIRAVPPGHALLRSAQGLFTQPVPPPAAAADAPAGLHARLSASLRRALASRQRIALALSGGLDSALLLALLCELGATDIPAYILVTDLPGYSERDAALDMAARLGVSTRLVPVSAADFVAALPQAIAAVEEPLFNLHPVAKLLLAQAMARDGIELAISGDGADQVLRRDVSANYLPLCRALFDAASVTLLAPFLDAAVVAWLLDRPADPDKTCLREIAARLELPARLVRGPKHSRLAPAMDLRRWAKPDELRALAAQLGLPEPTLSRDEACVRWTTLALALRQFGVIDTDGAIGHPYPSHS